MVLAPDHLSTEMDKMDRVATWHQARVVGRSANQKRFKRIGVGTGTLSQDPPPIPGMAGIPRPRLRFPETVHFLLGVFQACTCCTPECLDGLNIFALLE